MNTEPQDPPIIVIEEIDPGTFSCVVYARRSGYDEAFEQAAVHLREAPYIVLYQEDVARFVRGLILTFGCGGNESGQEDSLESLFLEIWLQGLECTDNSKHEAFDPNIMFPQDWNNVNAYTVHRAIMMLADLDRDEEQDATNPAERYMIHVYHDLLLQIWSAGRRFRALLDACNKRLGKPV